MAKDDTPLIDEYLLGQLSPSEHAAFEARLAKDTSLAQLVTERRTLMEKIEAYGDYQIKQQLKAIHQKEVGKKPTPASFRRWLWPLLLLIIVLLGLLFWWSSRPASPQQLYAVYYKTYPLNLSQRGEEKTSLLAQIDQYYGQGEFAIATPLLEQVLSRDSSQSQVRLALAICHIEAQEFDQALEELHRIAAIDFDPYQAQALWYMALVYLRQGEVSKARISLENLTNDKQGDFYKEAKAILQSLAKE